MKGLLAWLKGKKTYVCAVVAGITAAADYLGVEVPNLVYIIEGLLGVASLRAGIAKAEKAGG